VNIDWLLAPVTQAVILGAGLIGSLALWISAKIEARRAQKTFEAFRLSTQTLIKDLAGRVAEIGEAAVSYPAPSSSMTVQGLNLTTRTKALRMHRRGENISSIAAALEVRQEEIELLLKLERLAETPVV
jgi:hypothetical protein